MSYRGNLIRLCWWSLQCSLRPSSQLWGDTPSWFSNPLMPAASRSWCLRHLKWVRFAFQLHISYHAFLLSSVVYVMYVECCTVAVIRASGQWNGHRCCPSCARFSRWTWKVIWWLCLVRPSVSSLAFSTMSAARQNWSRMLMILCRPFHWHGCSVGCVTGQCIEVIVSIYCYVYLHNIIVFIPNDLMLFLCFHYISFVSFTGVGQ